MDKDHCNPINGKEKKIKKFKLIVNVKKNIIHANLFEYHKTSKKKLLSIELQKS